MIREGGSGMYWQDRRETYYKLYSPQSTGKGWVFYSFCHIHPYKFINFAVIYKV